MAMASSEGIDVGVVDTTDGLLALRSEWRELWEESPSAHYFHSFEYCWHVWNLVASVQGCQLRVVVVRQAGRLVLVWPLMRYRRSLRMLSSGTLEYRDALVREGPAAGAWMTAAWSVVQRTRGVDLYLLQNLRTPSNIDRLLGGLRGPMAVGGGWCPVIRLDRYADWGAYSKHLPKSMLDDQRRQWRRVREALPGVAFRIVTDATEAAATIDWIIDHKLRWLHAVNKSWSAEHFGSWGMREFFQATSKSAQEQGSLVLARLADGDTILSAGFGYRFRDEFLFHVFTYDLAWARVSPARLFLEELVRWCLDEGVTVFDFMPGDEQYKATWATDLVRTDSYAAPLTLWGSYLLRWHLPLARSVRTPRILSIAYGHLPERLREVVRRKLTMLNMLGLQLKSRSDPPRLTVK
jgi:CelD/BcsL family acetyltransferase involved in cellulose biosynthesis